MLINEWAKRHNISAAALADLQSVLTSAIPPLRTDSGKSETAGQQAIRLEAPHNGCMLWRNNVGACMDERGNHIRYGLVNDSKAVNQHVKSSDLIGITQVLIEPEHVGSTFGLFTATECKKAGWKYAGTQREKAQLAFLNIVISQGGIAQFATGPGDLWNT